MKRVSVIVVCLLAMAITWVSAGNVPTEVMQRIKKRIVSRYPDNYSMQKVLIQDEVACYLFLQRYTPPRGVPGDVFRRIKGRIVSRYPDNYSMQKVLIEDQVESYLSLHR